MLFIYCPRQSFGPEALLHLFLTIDTLVHDSQKIRTKMRSNTGAETIHVQHSTYIISPFFFKVREDLDKWIQSPGPVYTVGWCRNNRCFQTFFCVWDGCRGVLVRLCQWGREWWGCACSVCGQVADCFFVSFIFYPRSQNLWCKESSGNNELCLDPDANF